MKKLITLLLTATICLSLCACGKSEAVKNVETLITAIGEVTLDSEAAIIAAEEAYAALTAEEKEQVGNHSLLTDAREELRRQEYYGEWTTIPNGNVLTLDANGYDHTWTLTDNGISLTDQVDLVKVDHGDYIQLVGEYENGERIALIRTEHLTTRDIEITIDNWQDYFYIEETVERYFDEFGEEKGYVIHYDFRVNPEYANYLATFNDNELLVEYRTEHSGIYVNIDPETLEYTLGETEWQGGNPIIITQNLSCFDLFIFNNWEKYGYSPEDTGYERTVCTLWKTIVIENHRMASKPDYFTSDFPSNLEITRIKGTLSLYDLPIHQ